jgi:cytochrome c-type biogenesis protein CcmH/NrfG
MPKPAFFHYKKRYFPHIPRFITVGGVWVLILGGVFGGLWLLYATNATSRVYANTPQKGDLTHEELSHLYTTWQQVTQKQPEYLDGYIMASYYARLLKKPDEALLYLSQALSIDPNNIQILEQRKQLQEEIEK